MRDQLTAIGAEAERAGALLLHPEAANLDRCAEILEGAACELAAVRLQLRAAPGDDAFLPEARRVQMAVRRVAVLLENAAEFYQGWDAILGAMCSGYQAGGSAAPVVRGGSLCLEG